MIYRRTEEEMPCTKTELDLAMLDGCRVLWLMAPKEVVGEEGKVAGLVCQKDSAGRSR